MMSLLNMFKSSVVAPTYEEDARNYEKLGCAFQINNNSISAVESFMSAGQCYIQSKMPKHAIRMYLKAAKETENSVFDIHELKYIRAIEILNTNVLPLIETDVKGMADVYAELGRLSELVSQNSIQYAVTNYTRAADLYAHGYPSYRIVQLRRIAELTKSAQVFVTVAKECAHNPLLKFNVKHCLFNAILSLIAEHKHDEARALLLEAHTIDTQFIHTREYNVLVSVLDDFTHKNVSRAFEEFIKPDVWQKQMFNMIVKDIPT